MSSKRLYSAVVGGVVAISLIFGYAAFKFRGLLFGEKLVIYHLPKGLSGWILVKFDVPSCPALQEDRKAVHVRVDDKGLACTSSPLLEGFRKARYLQAVSSGTEEPLSYGSWDRANDKVWPVSLGFVSYSKAGETHHVPRELLFVGSKQELERAWSTQPSLE